MTTLDALRAIYDAEIAVSQRAAHAIATAPDGLRDLLAQPLLTEPYPTFEQWLARQSFGRSSAAGSFERVRHHVKGNGWKANHEGNV